MELCLPSGQIQMSETYKTVVALANMIVLFHGARLLFLFLRAHIK